MLRVLFRVVGLPKHVSNDILRSFYVLHMHDTFVTKTDSDRKQGRKVPRTPPLNKNIETAARHRLHSRSKHPVNEAGTPHFYAK